MDVPDQTPHETIDITGEVCPMTFVRTKLRLERMRPGEVLSVRLRGEEPLRNVPKAARDEGHCLLWIVPEGNDHTVPSRGAWGRAASPPHRHLQPSCAGSSPPAGRPRENLS